MAMPSGRAAERWPNRRADAAAPRTQFTHSVKESGLRLEISPKTVEAHVSSVLRKLQLSSRHELTRWATDRGLG